MGPDDSNADREEEDDEGSVDGMDEGDAVERNADESVEENTGDAGAAEGQEAAGGDDDADGEEQTESREDRLAREFEQIARELRAREAPLYGYDIEHRGEKTTERGAVGSSLGWLTFELRSDGE